MAVNRIAILVKTRHFTLLAAEPYKPELNPGERRFWLIDVTERTGQCNLLQEVHHLREAFLLRGRCTEAIHSE
jgi:hypothetical protein